MSALRELDEAQAALARLRDAELAVAAFSAGMRGKEQLLGGLPAPYREVLLDLLDRLESGALFSEESCSFSQRDLLDNLQLWMDKARARLG